MVFHFQKGLYSCLETIPIDKYRNYPIGELLRNTPSAMSDPLDSEARQGQDHVHAKAIGGTNLGKKYYMSFRLIGSMLAMALSLCAAYVGYLLPVGILSYINADIGPDPNYSLIPVAWSICNAIGYLIVGRMSDIFGRRYFFLGGNVLGLIGFIVCATARNVQAIIGGNVFIGIAAAVALSFYSGAGELVPVKDRGYWYFAIFVPVLPFAMFGAYIAHDLLIVATWRWCYYIAIIIQGLSIILFAVAYFPPRLESLHTIKSRQQLIKEIDYLGIFLFCAGTVLFLLGISWGGSNYPWKSASVLCPLVIGAVTLIAFFVWEMKGSIASPLLPWEFLVENKRGFLLPALVAGIGSMFYYGLTVIWPYQVNTVYGTDLRTGGWLASILSCASQTGTMFASLIFTKIGPQRNALIAAFITMVAFVGGLTQTNPGNRPVAIACTVLSGFCIGFSETLIILFAQVQRDAHMIGLTVGVLGFIRLVFGAVAQAVYLTILSNRLPGQLASKITRFALEAGIPQASLPAVFSALASTNPEALSKVQGITPAQVAAVVLGQSYGYAGAFSVVYWACFAFGCLGIIGTFFVKRDVNDELTTFVPKKMEGVTTRTENLELEEKMASGAPEHVDGVSYEGNV
ncbi:hypothetical protein PV11_03511 [Exophiala sideris]|uniref:Major facilitator superfamily (MFS) profile domain-containing protein n=1 Tax=Exophiala sideris TaxID=1016849 RepID=A0A0D1YJY3_9EURO|nr:hypothetical protein PV11_03511 [Exophiala sideris]